jgi:hypothetical protein
VNVLRLHLWKEWREHRLALLAVTLTCTAMMTGAWIFRAPSLPMIWGVIAVLVFLLAVGGELLGERRSGGLAWIQRLPSGLGPAFCAKLVFFLTMATLVAAQGYGAGWLLECLRDRRSGGLQQDIELFVVAVAVIWGVWTFAVSTWTLRGGLSLLAAALVVCVLGFPIWRVLEAGYRPASSQLWALSGALASSALVGAWLGFVHGARLGRGTLSSAVFGLGPALPVLLVVSLWSAARLEEREALDPLAKDFIVRWRMITDDGRTAFVAAKHERRRWASDSMPLHALRVDLEEGSFEPLGILGRQFDRYREDEHGLYHLDETVIAAEGRQPSVFDVARGEPREWDSKKNDLGGWRPKGLGLEVFQDTRKPRAIRDPFRKRDYPVAGLGECWYAGTLLVRPGRWLYSPSSSSSHWLWLDPDTNERSLVDWPEHAKPLVLFDDGRILLADPEQGLRLVQPEENLSVALDSRGIPAEHIQANLHCLRVPPQQWRSQDAGRSGTIVLRTTEQAWLILDENASDVRRLPVPDSVGFVCLRGRDTAIVSEWNRRGGFSRLDLVTGELTALWPREPME